MKINDIITKIKAYHKGVWNGNVINDATTRDKVLYGDVNQECTGIVFTCWATVDVIAQAAKKGANLIIAHEAMFWNHGDHIDWLQAEGNETFLAKKKLLDDSNMVVWRNHDYIHSGIPMADGSYVDGIFYGLAKILNWTDYIQKDQQMPMYFEIPETTVKELAKCLIEKLHLQGVRIIGDSNNKVHKVKIPTHILGDHREIITEVDHEQIDCLLTMELVDFTVAEYIRDSSMLGLQKSIISIGHFNLEEPGMEYMVEYIPQLLGMDIPCEYIQSGDMYSYILED